MVDVELSLAICAYDHVRALTDGTARVEGVQLNVQHFEYPSDIFHRSLEFGEWDIAELSFAKYVSLVGHGDERFVAIPVFPSRMFRHSAVFVRSDSELVDLAELSGCRVGIPEWAQTAGVYVRGVLHDEHGVDLAGIQWFQGGVNALGRTEHAEIEWPKGVEVTTVTDRPLAAMLKDKELDAIIAASGPISRGSEFSFRPLLRDAARVEREYWARTGIFPIMHVVAIRRPVHDRYPWLAANLRRAFEQAKAASLSRLAMRHASLYPIPQVADALADARTLFGGEPWPYGLVKNSPTIEAFLRYAHDQGISGRTVAAEELFVPASMDEFRN